MFAAGILSVLLSGAGVYRRVTLRDEGAYDRRTCVQYLATRVRQTPSARAITVTKFGDGDCLLITEEMDGAEYLTRVYCHEGWLMELFSPAGLSFAPEDGARLFPLAALVVEREAGLLRMTAEETDGETVTFLVTPRGGEEGAG